MEYSAGMACTKFTAVTISLRISEFYWWVGLCCPFCLIYPGGKSFFVLILNISPMISSHLQVLPLYKARNCQDRDAHKAAPISHALRITRVTAVDRPSPYR